MKLLTFINDGQMRPGVLDGDQVIDLAAAGLPMDETGDLLRIPPVRTAEPAAVRPIPKAAFTPVILFEDEALLVIDKPSGLAVHGGSGLSFGVIEALRQG
ncbi:MAG: hypothetical protein ACTS5G_04160, partial [Burkholderiales bacterium]